MLTPWLCRNSSWSVVFNYSLTFLGLSSRTNIFLPSVAWSCLVDISFVLVQSLSSYSHYACVQCDPSARPSLCICGLGVSSCPSNSAASPRLRQCAIWNTWGPITEAALVAFPGWGELTISSLTNVALIAFIVFMAPYCYLLDKKGQW